MPGVASVWIWPTGGAKCDPSTLRVLICLRKAPGRLQICKNVTAAGRLRVPSSHSYLMAPLLKASFASCGVFIFTSRVPVITYKCCCHLVQLFTDVLSGGDRAAVALRALLLLFGCCCPEEKDNKMTCSPFDAASRNLCASSDTPLRLTAVLPP